MKHDVRIFADTAELYDATAAAVDQVIRDAIRDGGKASVVLSGGRTPLPLYRRLARMGPWHDLYLFWSDERVVPPESARSNYGQAHEVWLSSATIGGAFPMRNSGETLEHAVHRYTDLIREHVTGPPVPRFDLILLGIGADGHIASLFPGDRTALDPSWVVPVPEPHGGVPRISLGSRVILSAHRSFVLASGETKAPAIRQAMDRPASAEDIEACPARLLWDASGDVTWFLDSTAAARIEQD